ncbi:hypothetical protein JAAARDRAFT_31123 [Jaapia argillacea MUCL 33604]|uniref:EF-hand domain-containing protein n=1 Tax=Jaapia argillacea MUCL 33604 TaxID=933084 RepID=A0A067Q3L9_9AGAM|nr:hypothetical protein JAAARDRAFT_31123 [Jaapia argillacea MUCL 33604]
MTTLPDDDSPKTFSQKNVSDHSSSTGHPGIDRRHWQDSTVDQSQLNDSCDNDSGTVTNSSDEFNWDEDDEHPEAQSPPDEKARRGRAVWLAFMKLARPLRTLVVGILGVGILITPLLVFQWRFKRSPIEPHIYVWSLWLAIIWAAGCLASFVVDFLPRLIISMVLLFGGQIERLRTQIELTLAVSAWLKFTLDISWAWISLAVIRGVVQPPGSYWIIVNRVMQALFAAGILLLLEKVFLRFVAINFHQKALAERLAENRLGLKALDRLSNAQPTPVKRAPCRKKGHKSLASSADLFGARTPSVGKEDQVASTISSSINETTNSLNARVEGKRNWRRAMTSVIVDQLGDVIGQVALKNATGTKVVGELYSARRLAKKLFSTLRNTHPARSHLRVEDFYPYFASTAEAHAAFTVFDKDGNGDITKPEMREAVQRIYRERKSLIASLKDVSSIVAKLDAVLIAVVIAAITFICLLVFNPSDSVTSLVPLATIILGFSFIFGNSAQRLFESLIFIFSTHVFDVGDLVMIDDQPLFVREFGLFSTVFRRVDGQEIIVPNALLSSAKLVHNMRRSNSMWETTNLVVSYNTPLELIEQLRQRLKAYMTENNREWSNCDVHINKMEYQNAITLIIALEHRPSWQDWGGRWGRRTLFMRHLKTVLEELDIQYTMPVQPVLLPKGSPFVNGSSYIAQVGQSGLPADNLGSFGGSDFMLRAPGSTIRSDPNSFLRGERF